MITYNEEKRIFKIDCGEMSYVFAINNSGRLVHLYWGAYIATNMSDFDDLIEDDFYMFDFLNKELKSGYLVRVNSHMEYGVGEACDYTEPCLKVRFFDGAETLRMVCKSHEIYEENGREVLKITLCDEFYPLEVDLYYKTWDKLSLLSRHACIRNTGNDDITLLSAKSATLNMPSSTDYRLTHYSGCWSCEYVKNTVLLTQAKTVLETNRLTEAASYQMPFFALDEMGSATEKTGEVYFGALHYSGDFSMSFETSLGVTSKNTTVIAGVNPSTAQIPLKQGECFETPALTVGFSSRGFEHMSEILYDWQFDYLLPKGNTNKAHAERPVIYNTWYPYAFRIDEQKIIDFIPKAKSIGTELFVIDDGWMRGRSNSKCGLGDWIIDTERFPRGLGYISDMVHASGMLFGLWVEPEMANFDSDVFRNHPDWFLHEPNRERTSVRNQTILDLSRDDLRDYTINWLDELIENAKLDYLKWDMNRDVSEIGFYGFERGVAVKYMKNLEYIWKHLNEKFPDLLLENCASGGGRADFGMLPYADRVNRSDNADPVDVLYLHEGYTTFFVPKLAGGAGNVAPSPYYLAGRSTPLEYRTNLGMTGSYSIGINILNSSQEELDCIANAVQRFKELRPALQDSYVYRICSVYDKPYQVLQYLKRDKSSFTIFAFEHGMMRYEKDMPRLRMRGLEPGSLYKCNERIMSGQALMNFGVQIELKGDYASLVQTWERI